MGMKVCEDERRWRERLGGSMLTARKRQIYRARHSPNEQCLLDDALYRRNRTSCPAAKVHHGNLFAIPYPAQRLLQDLSCEYRRRGMLQWPNPVCPCKSQHVLDGLADGRRRVGLFMKFDKAGAGIWVHGEVLLERVCGMESAFMAPTRSIVLQTHRYSSICCSETPNSG